MPLVAASLTRDRGGFNLCLGLLGVATSLGGTLSTGLAGVLADDYGAGSAFLTLAACGIGAVLAAYLATTRGRHRRLSGERVRTDRGGSSVLM